MPRQTLRLESSSSFISISVLGSAFLSGVNVASNSSSSTRETEERRATGSRPAGFYRPGDFGIACGSRKVRRDLSRFVFTALPPAGVLYRGNKGRIDIPRMYVRSFPRAYLRRPCRLGLAFIGSKFKSRKGYRDASAAARRSAKSSTIYLGVSSPTRSIPNPSQQSRIALLSRRRGEGSPTDVRFETLGRRVRFTGDPSN